jgi:hypothetical protein
MAMMQQCLCCQRIYEGVRRFCELCLRLGHCEYFDGSGRKHSRRVSNPILRVP